MEIEPERRGAVCQENRQRRRIRRIERAWARGRARPDGVQRQQICKVQRGNKRAPDVGIGVAGQRAEPGFQGVDAFQTAAEALSLDGTTQFTGIVLERVQVIIHQDDDRGQIASAHISGLHIGLGLFCVLAHDKRVPIDLGVRAIEELVKKSNDTLIPALDVVGDFLFRVELFETDEAARPAQFKGQRVQGGKHGWPAFLRQAVNGQHGQMLLLKAIFQTRDQTANQVARTYERVQIHGRIRDAHGLEMPGHAELKVAQEIGMQIGRVRSIVKFIFLQPRHTKEYLGKTVLDLGQRFREGFKALFQSR